MYIFKPPVPKKGILAQECPREPMVIVSTIDRTKFVGDYDGYWVTNLDEARVCIIIQDAIEFVDEIMENGMCDFDRDLGHKMGGLTFDFEHVEVMTLRDAKVQVVMKS